jgi:ABC-type lipoprotein release transport system permease subunit
MIPILAWRNIWRNPTRSLVVILAIGLGIWAAMFMSGFATGMAQSYIDNAIADRVSHIQIHHPDYAQDKDARFTITATEGIYDFLEVQAPPAHYSPRTLVNGMIASSKASRGIQVVGISPEREASVTGLSEKIIEGDFFVSDRKNQLLISSRIADKLDVKIRSRLVLTFQDMQRNITSAAFRVSGIFESGNNAYDEANVFVPQADLQRLIGTDSLSAPVHEIAIYLEDATLVDTLQKALQARFPATKVENYREIAPDVQLYESMIGSVSMIYLVIIMLALVFGIINTMLMAVLERVKELGMLMAIGMNKVRVFFMIVLETVFLSLAGAPLGILLGWLSIAFVGKYGLDLSAFSSTMKMYGLSQVIYFEVAPGLYGQVAIAVTITAIIASIYPALKAIRLKPVEAIRKI